MFILTILFFSGRIMIIDLGENVLLINATVFISSIIICIIIYFSFNVLFKL